MCREIIEQIVRHPMLIHHEKVKIAVAFGRASCMRAEEE
jgi:hypothetical protein